MNVNLSFILDLAALIAPLNHKYIHAQDTVCINIRNFISNSDTIKPLFTNGS